MAKILQTLLARLSRFNFVEFSFKTFTGLVMAGVALALGSQRAHGQAPPLLWRTNIGASVIAIDNLTNVYASSNGTVIKLNGDGVPLQTNILSDLRGRAARDVEGNFYFAGVRLAFFDQSFYEYGTTNALFLAKYTPTGTLVWSNGFGPTGGLRSIKVDDLRIDTNGNVYAGFNYVVTTMANAVVAKLDTSGSNIWTTEIAAFPSDTFGAIRFGKVFPTNGHVISYYSLLSWRAIKLTRFGSNGTPTTITNWDMPYDANTPPLIQDSGNDFYGGDGGLTKRDPSGAVVWQNPAFVGQPVGPDFYGGAHVSGNGILSRADSAGNLVWTTNFQTFSCNELLVDSSGNRFLSFSDGSVGRLGAESIFAVQITNSPQSQTAFVGSNVTFTVGADGSTPLRYYWYCNGSLFSVQANPSLTFLDVNTNLAGSYYVVVSNLVNTVTSAPVQLRVKQVAFYIGSQLLTNGTYTMDTNPVVTIRSAFTNGSVFYTTDGSTPSFNSTFYSGPILLNQSATLRAIGYSADFSQSEDADVVNAVITAHHMLMASSYGGGHVTLNPPGGDYPSSNTVTATAVPDAGWLFLYWTGDASGSSASVDISMGSDKSIHAVFGTTLSTTVQGNGQIVIYPPGGLYSYGQTVRLTAVPGTGSYFGAWGNSVTGSTNPLYFTVTNPTPTISSIFGTDGANQVTLTLNINGSGTVTVSPPANIYTNGQSLTLTATPGVGQSFVNWSGDASGSQNPLAVTLNQSEIINANFTGGPFLRADPKLGEGLRPEGFRFSVVSDPNSVYEIRASSNLTSWQSLGFVTNSLGETQLLDTNAIRSPMKFYRLMQ